MKKIYRTDAQIIKDIGSAGMTFLVHHIVDIMNNISKLNQLNFKCDYIEKIFNNPEEHYDNYISNTKTRVNSAIRIIRADKVIFMFEYIINRPRQRVVNDRANELLLKIKNGEIILPVFE